MNKVLIIKTGAAGDVARTTVLLNVLQARITWVIDEKYKDILPDYHPHLTQIVSLKNANDLSKDEQFDLIISLEEDIQCGRLASRIKSKQITGVYVENNEMKYTPDSSGWFDMSLISSLGFEQANTIKSKNKLSFQHCLFNMIGLTFGGEPYCIYKNEQIKAEPKSIGIEKRSGSRWPNKFWTGYEELEGKLKNQGYTIKNLTQRNSLREYMDDIAACNYVISGDTFAMHVAIAYQKPSLAIFNCTSPEEIYDYGILKKMVSPILLESFYKTNFCERSSNAIRVKEIEDAATRLFKISVDNIF
jgi:heptosyltransferase-2